MKTKGKEIKVEFLNSRKQKLRGIVHVPKKYTTAVIFLHGFPGTMEGTAKIFCRTLSLQGLLCMRFSFDGVPPSEGKFEDKLMSNEVKDIRSAINYLSKNYSFSKLVLIGHSTGAIDAALYAHSDRRVTSLVLSGAVCNLENAARYDFSDSQVKDFWTKGYALKCAVKPKKKSREWVWKAQRGKIKKAFYDEFFALDIPKAIKAYKKPLLILHGEKDEAIPATKEPRKLYKIANSPKKLVIVKGADHSYSKKQYAVQAIKAVSSFIQKY